MSTLLNFVALLSPDTKKKPVRKEPVKKSPERQSISQRYQMQNDQNNIASTKGTDSSSENRIDDPPSHPDATSFPGTLGCIESTTSAIGMLASTKSNALQPNTTKNSKDYANKVMREPEVNFFDFTLCDPCYQTADTFATTTKEIRGWIPGISPFSQRRRSGRSRRASSARKEKKVDKPCPVEKVELESDRALDLERSISELTMRSSYGGYTAKLSNDRRVAFYAVGKHNTDSGKGGNRRCYFSGKLISGRSPFYAGSVQQGVRTLVVFCLPSTLGLPGGMPSEMARNPSNKSTSSRSSKKGVGSRNPSIGGVPRAGTRSSGTSMRSMHEMSCSTEGSMDSNWELNNEELLSVLPTPNDELLGEMARLYPAEFETLPQQVRSSHIWKLHINFCFFSGLPICDGEMHYRVRDEVALKEYGGEIVLSHDVMEAANGDSVEMLRLPNRKTFMYLKKNYTEQSSKLPSIVFERRNWELQLPEV